MQNTQSDFEGNLTAERNELLDKLVSVFRDLVLEGHLVGSMARGDSDPHSDIDIWFTLSDTEAESIISTRFDVYSKVGEIVHICEAPQNSPINGKFSGILFRTENGIIHADISLCPQSTSFITKESRTIFGGIDLPDGVLGLNPHKVSVDGDYRIDFMVCMIFGGIKKIVRKEESALKDVLLEYNYLEDRYNIKTGELSDLGHSFNTLREVISNIVKISNERQATALIEILNFLEKVETIN